MQRCYRPGAGIDRADHAQSNGRVTDARPTARAFRRFRPTDAAHRVTTFELFFDLVFVFARGLLLMALLWWAWCSYAWLGNQAHAEEGVVRVTMLTAMAAMFVMALAIPESFEDLPGGLDAPVVLAVCYVVVRAIHLACYLVAATGDPGLQRQLRVTAVPVGLAGVVLLSGAVVGPPYRPHSGRSPCSSTTPASGSPAPRAGASPARATSPNGTA